MRHRLLITDDFLPNLGGIANYLGNLYRDTPVTVLAQATPGGASFDETGEFASLRYRTRGRFLIQVLEILLRARPLLRSDTGWICSGTLLASGVAGALLSAWSGLPHLVHVYGTDLFTTRRGRVPDVLARWVLRSAAAVITISDFADRRAIELGAVRERTHKVVPCIDAGHFRPAPRAAGPPRLLTVARLVERKGHDVVLKALTAIVQQVPDLVYTIVGDGPERPRLERIAADLGIARNVEFVGAVGDTLPYYQQCDIFVLASRTIAAAGEVEGFGIAFCEAGACGKPVVAGDSGGCAEAVLHDVTGLLVAPEDPAGLAAAVLELLQRPEQARALGANGRRRVESNFSPAAQRARLEAILDGHGGGGEFASQTYVPLAQNIRFDPPASGTNSCFALS